MERRERPRRSIDRTSPTDLMFLSMEAGPVPEQLGAVLVLHTEPRFDLPTVRNALAERIRTVPRLRQRLVRVPPWCGRPIWVDDAEFDIGRHVRHLVCPAPANEQALLDRATTIITLPLPRSRPLWRAVFVTGLADGRTGLIVVLHHVLADGIGGLAVLSCLVDEAEAHPDDTRFPQRPPTSVALITDALLGRVRALSHVPRTVRAITASMRWAGGVTASERAAPCSLLTPTGPRRRVTVVRAGVAQLRAAAHRQGATVNDVVLTAVTGALHTLLQHRGESLDNIVVAVPVAGRRSTTVAQLGNQNAPILAVLPATGGREERLRRTAAVMRSHKALMTGPPLFALLGAVGRAAAALGAYGWFMRRQHLLHTLVTNLHGPDQVLTIVGAPVAQIVPLTVGGADNVTVYFGVLSYAGTLTITVFADPDHVPDLPVLTTALQDDLAGLVALAHEAHEPTAAAPSGQLRPAGGVDRE